MIIALYIAIWMEWSKDSGILGREGGTKGKSKVKRRDRKNVFLGGGSFLLPPYPPLNRTLSVEILYRKLTDIVLKV